jgi:hypothetical protein
MIIGMSLRTERYRKKAIHCEQAAEYVTDAATKALYLDLAHQWQELARQAEMLDREHREC